MKCAQLPTKRSIIARPQLLDQALQNSDECWCNNGKNVYRIDVTRGKARREQQYIESSQNANKETNKFREPRIEKKESGQLSKWCQMKSISAGSKLRIAGPLAAERPGHHRDANPEQKSPLSAWTTFDLIGCGCWFGAEQVGTCSLLY